MFTLSSWLMKSRRCPWSTAKVGNSWCEAGERYLRVVPRSQELTEHACVTILSECGCGCTATLAAVGRAEARDEAQPDDVLMQVFSEAILKETLVLHVQCDVCVLGKVQQHSA